MFLSHDIRRDVETNLLLQNSVHIRINGERVKRLNPDERSTAALIKPALKALADATADEEVQSTPGIFVARRALSDVIEGLLLEHPVPVVLHEDGKPAETYAFPDNPAFTRRRWICDVGHSAVSIQAEKRVILARGNHLDRRPSVLGPGLGLSDARGGVTRRRATEWLSTPPE